MKRRAAVALTTVLVFLGALSGVAARAEPSTTVRYPAGASGTWFKGKAFDACAAPSRSALKAWLSSPYRGVGIYISGPLRACDQSRLTADWVSDVTAMGWKLLPIDVGLQAPCRASTRLQAMSRTTSTAEKQGAAAATRSIAAAARLGIRPGSALYSDLETFFASGDVECARAVRSYVAGWTRTLHRNGYLSGVYASHHYGATTLAESYDSVIQARPDALWAARWDNDPHLRGWTGIADEQWPMHQRSKQYRGDHTESHGGVSINIDSNSVDGPVATVALPYPVTLGAGLVRRSTPSLTGAVRGAVAQGSTVRAVCQVHTTLGTWDKLSDGTYLPDAVLSAGAPKPQLTTCMYPFQMTKGANLRAGPAVGQEQRGVTYDGALAWIMCESPGITLGLPGFWQRLQGGLWVSGALVAVPDPRKRTAGIPLCTPG